MELSYVSRNLRKTISFKDIVSNPFLDNETKRVNLSSQAATLTNQSDVFNNSLKKISIKSKDAYQPKTIEIAIILKLLSSNLRRVHNISPSSRVQIVSTLIAFLKESSPYSIHRFDIKNFYESIDTSKIVHKLKKQGKVSKKSRNLVEAYLTALNHEGVSGLARGLSLSATLSEYVLEDLDRKIRALENIFFYARFVDDLVLITEIGFNKEELKSLINSVLPESLELHTAGKKIFHGKAIKPTDSKTTPINSFEYLGYKFVISNKNHPKEKFIDIKRRDIEIDISEDKLDKLRKRLIKSFTSYICSTKNPSDYELLQKRIKFLTGNYELDRNLKTGKIKSGIYYNYSLVNTSKGLNKLDNFLKGLLFSKKHKLSRRIQQHISLIKRRELANFSFTKGHNKKRFHTFTYLDLKEIKKVW